MERQQDYVLRTVEERGVRFVQLWFTDVLGMPKSFNITPAELENALEEGMTFDGSAIDGFSRVQESDVLAMPDPKTFQLLPYQADDVAGGPGVLRHATTSTGPRSRATPARCCAGPWSGPAASGFTFFVAPELEYFYFARAQRTIADGMPPVPLDQGSYFDLTATDLTSDLRQPAVLTLEEMGIPVEYTQHEDAPSQHEIDLRYTDALTMADTVMTFRMVVKEIAAQRGRATPASCPSRSPACRARACTPTCRSSRATPTPSTTTTTSTACRRWPGGSSPGCLRHAREITAVTNQWVNSYKRLIAGYEAPVYISWARNNRSALVRVPVVKKGKPDSTRIEYRAPDCACNPYLAFAVLLAAGLTGIEEGYDLPPEAAANLYQLSEQERVAERHRRPARLAGRGGRRDGAVRAGGGHPRRARLRVVHPQQAGGVGGLQGRGDPVRAAAVPPLALTGTTRLMEPLLIFPDPAPAVVVQALGLGGYPWTAVDSAEGGTERRARGRVVGRDRLRRRGPRGRLRPVPRPAQAATCPSSRSCWW